MFTVTSFPPPQSLSRDSSAYKKRATLYKTRNQSRIQEITPLTSRSGACANTSENRASRKTLSFYIAATTEGWSPSLPVDGPKGSIYEGACAYRPYSSGRPGFLQEIDVPAYSSDLYPTLLAVAGVNQPEKQPILDGIDLLPILEGKKRTRTPMGFWHGFRNGQGTWSDRIIKALWDADKAGKPNPHPERILKNVNSPLST